MAAGGAHPPLIVLYRQPNGWLWCVDRAAGCCDALLSRTHRAGGSIAWLWRSVARSRKPLAARTYRTRRRCRHTSELHAGHRNKSGVGTAKQRLPEASVRRHAVLAAAAVHGPPDEVHHALAAVRNDVKRLRNRRRVGVSDGALHARRSSRNRLLARRPRAADALCSSGPGGTCRRCGAETRSKALIKTARAHADAPAPHAVGCLVARVCGWRTCVGQHAQAGPQHP